MSECTTVKVKTDALGMFVQNGESATLSVLQTSMVVTKEEIAERVVAEIVAQKIENDEETTLEVNTEVLDMVVQNGEGLTLIAAPISMAVEKERIVSIVTQGDLGQTLECVDELPGAYSNGYSAGYTTGTGP